MVARNVGDVVVAKNGYSYTYIEAGNGKPIRTLTHWVIAYKKYGRSAKPGERVVFKDGDRANLRPDNIEYVPSGTNERKSLNRRKATLEDRIREARAELAEVDAALKRLDLARSNGKTT